MSVTDGSELRATTAVSRWRSIDRRRRDLVVLLASISLVLSLATVVRDLSTRNVSDFGEMHAGTVVALAHGDPYSADQVAAVEQREQGLGPGDATYLYLYPPTFTAAELPLGHLTLHRALQVWVVLLALGSILAVVAGTALLSSRPRRIEEAALLLAAFLAFAPVRDGLTLGQVDPILGGVALLGLLLALEGHDVYGGVLLSALLLKPQTGAITIAALVLLTRRPRLAGGVVTGVVIQISAVLAARAAGTGLGSALGWITPGAQSDYRGAAILAVEAALAATGMILIVGRLAHSQRGLLEVAVLGACLNTLVAGMFYLHSQSNLLLLLPLGVVLKDLLARGAGASWLRRLGVGVVVGLLAGDALFAVTQHAGVAHAALPLLVVALVLAAAAVQWRGVAAVAPIALITNIVITLPPISPEAHQALAAGAALGLVVLLIRVDVTSTLQPDRTPSRAAST